MLTVWISFMCFGALSILLKADAAVRSPLSGITGLKHYFVIERSIVGHRFAWASLLFWLWTLDPSVLNRLIPSFLGGFDFTVPLNPATAGMAGLAADAILDKIFSRLGMQNIVPPVSISITTVEEKTVTTEATTETKTVVDVPEVVSEKKDA